MARAFTKRLLCLALPGEAAARNLLIADSSSLEGSLE